MSWDWDYAQVAVLGIAMLHIRIPTQFRKQCRSLLYRQRKFEKKDRSSFLNSHGIHQTQIFAKQNAFGNNADIENKKQRHGNDPFNEVLAKPPRPPCPAGEAMLDEPDTVAPRGPGWGRTALILCKNMHTI